MNDMPASSGFAAENPQNRFSGVRRRLAPILAIPTPVVFLAAAGIATYLMWRQGSLAEVSASLQSVSVAWVLAILAAYALSIFMLGVRWHALTSLAGGAPPLFSSAEVFLTSVIVNYAAPIGLGVPTRAALTVRDLGLTPMQSGAVVGWELILDILALLLISAMWLILGGTELIQSAAIDGRLGVAAAVLALGGVGLILALVRVETLRERSARLLGPMISQPSRRPALALFTAALTVIYWGVQMGVIAGLLAVFGVVPNLSLVAGMMGLPVLIGMLSPVPGGAGVREALMAASAQLAGVAAAPVILAAVAFRMALFVVTPLVWGVLKLARMWSSV